MREELTSLSNTSLYIAVPAAPSAPSSSVSKTMSQGSYSSFVCQSFTPLVYEDITQWSLFLSKSLKFEDNPLGLLRKILDHLEVFIKHILATFGSSNHNVIMLLGPGTFTSNNNYRMVCDKICARQVNVVDFARGHQQVKAFTFSRKFD